jgi:hypothetical protein
MRLVQLHGYSQFAWEKSNVKTYCETGVNGGHGTAAMLLANPKLVAHSFDEGGQPYSDMVFQTLSLYFGERFILHRGNSHVLLPPFAANRSNIGKCDILLVDGDHSEHGAYKDIVDMRPLAACGAVVLLDDIVETIDHRNGGPQQAIKRVERQGIMTVTERHVYNTTTRDNPCLRDKHGRRHGSCFYPWGWAIAKYNDDENPACRRQG